MRIKLNKQLILEAKLNEEQKKIVRDGVIATGATGAILGAAGGVMLEKSIKDKQIHDLSEIIDRHKDNI